MALSRWVVGISALLLSACGGPAESEAEAGLPVGDMSTVEQRAEEPGGGARYGQHRTYYREAAKVNWAGAWHADCSGYISQSGQVTAYYTDAFFICS
ncbi:MULTISPECIES: hypothetical protein [Myxococcus]|uniref:hypothetical protein n=1 Tax=Myxococcus TaxID=32 RepID=UPI00112A1142|nr:MULTISPECIES: hypothetical protein [Myxococcus]QDE82833.1 hypothetical protein BHS07_15450 [Myxococcus xanthus]QDE97104.1 hypothetical protein BHS05_15335 [Myxococcus xanthus]WAM29582.1 hypothetical protein OZ403_16210 [Myxococcus sp. NMCA1]